MSTKNIKDFASVQNVDLSADSILILHENDLNRLNGATTSISGIYQLNATNIDVNQLTTNNRPLINGTGVLLSGEAAGLPTTIVYTTGQQIISGNKNFIDDVIIGNVNQDDLLIISGEIVNFSVRPTVNNTGVLLIGEDIKLPNHLLYSTGDQNISGIKTFDVAPILSGNSFITGLDLSSYLTNTNASSTYSTINDLSLTGSTLNTKIDSLGNTYATVTNLASTGSTLDSKIGSLSGTLTSDYATITNLASTGSVLNSKIGSLSGTLTSDYATITNLASTGSTLDSKINSLSGNAVLKYGEQTIAGNKIFDNKLSINSYTTAGYDSTNNDFRLNIAGNTNVGDGILIDSYGGATSASSNIIARKARGTATNLSGLQKDDLILLLQARGYSSGAGYINNSRASCRIYAEENWTGTTNHGTYMEFRTANSGTSSAVNKLVINSSGVSILNGNLYISGNPALTVVDLSSYSTVTSFNALSGNVLFLNENQTVNGFKTFNTGILFALPSSGTGIFGIGPYINITGALASGNLFTGINMSVVDDSRNTNSRMLSLRAGVSGLTERFFVPVSGTSIMNTPFNINGNVIVTGTITSSSSITTSSTITATSTMQAGGVTVTTNNRVRWNPQTDLFSENTGLLSQRDGINPQQFRVFNLTGTNTGEFGLFGWKSNQLIIGSQQSQSGILRDLTLTGNNININPSGMTNIVGNLNVKGNILLSGNSVLTGIDLSLYATTTNLENTGSNLQNQINSLGNTYATVTDLASTGSNLNSSINSLSNISVLNYGNQSIAGDKTFTDNVIINGSGIINNNLYLGSPNISTGSSWIGGAAGNSGDYTFTAHWGTSLNTGFVSTAQAEIYLDGISGKRIVMPQKSTWNILFNINVASDGAGFYGGYIFNTFWSRSISSPILRGIGLISSGTTTNSPLNLTNGFYASSGTSGAQGAFYISPQTNGELRVKVTPASTNLTKVKVYGEINQISSL